MERVPVVLCVTTSAFHEKAGMSQVCFCLFEADVVKGVEDAGDADEEEVRTHEVPRDDVPGEYPDKK